jgi:hypothetical protein
LKAINDKILLLTSLAVFCIVLPFGYLRQSGDLEQVSYEIQDLENEIRTAENKDYSVADDYSLDFLDRVHENKPEASERILGGTCFYELHEIEGFLKRKIEGMEEELKVYPPLSVSVYHAAEGVEIAWANNPRNEALIKNLLDNPLLTLSYKIYRWSSGPKSRPVAIKTLPYTRNRYVDTTTGPLGNRFFYSVLTVFEGKVETETTLIESERSVTRSIDCEDQFKLRLAGGRSDRVNIEITVDKAGQEHSYIFPVTVGDTIGSPVGLNASESIDFSTTLTLTTIGTREETREELVRHPVFNADGSRTLDTISGQPVYDERHEMRTLEIITIECEDASGNKRVYEES